MAQCRAEALAHSARPLPGIGINERSWKTIRRPAALKLWLPWIISFEWPGCLVLAHDCFDVCLACLVFCDDGSAGTQSYSTLFSRRRWRLATPILASRPSCRHKLVFVAASAPPIPVEQHSSSFHLFSGALFCRPPVTTHRPRWSMAALG
jgi:hypothetical protein